MAKTSGFGLTRSLIHMLDADGKPFKPTITPTPGFSASADAERLHRAMKGAGTDEDTLISILARRTNYERQEICESYQSLYKKSLRDAVRDDTSGQFRTVLCELIMDTPYMLAKSLYHAMKGLGTNDRVLIEILTTLWNDEVKAVAEAYKEVLKHEGEDDSKHSLVQDLKKDTSGDFEYALMCLAQAERDDIPVLQLKGLSEKGVQSVTNLELANADAHELYTCGVGRTGTNEKRVTRVICNRTPFQLKLTMEAYGQLYHRDLIQDIKSETSGDYQKLLVAILRYATDRSTLMAEWLHDSVAGLGTKDYTLMRLLITRSEIDLATVLEVFESKYGKLFEKCIEGDTTGFYYQTLLRLMSAN